MKTLIVLIILASAMLLNAEPIEHGSWVSITTTDVMTDDVSELVFSLVDGAAIIFMNESRVVIDADRIVSSRGELLIRLDTQDARLYEYVADGSLAVLRDARPSDFIDAEIIRARVPLVRGNQVYSWSTDGLREAFERFGWSVD